MSALVFMGGLWAVLAGTARTVCTAGEQDAVRNLGSYPLFNLRLAIFANRGRMG
jgi:hypothetical protein